MAAGRDRERDVVEDLLAGVVLEVDVVEADLASERRRGLSVGRIAERGRHLEHLHYPLGGGERLGGPLHRLRRAPERTVRTAEVADEDDQLAGCQRSPQSADGSEREHDR